MLEALLLLLVLLIAPPPGIAATDPALKPVRIAVLQFMHETVTFLPYDTELDDFIYEGSPASGDALLSAGSYHTSRSSPSGFVKVAREHANVELVGIESPLGSKKGSGSGWITKEAYQHFTDRMVEALKAQGPFDGSH